MTAPTFVIAGAARAGTTAMAESLRAHPDVFVSRPKEPHYLALGDRAVAFTGPGDAETVNRTTVRDMQTYLALFDRAGRARAVGEASVSVLYHPERSATRLQRLNPEARVVVLLRDPVDRAYSSHQYLRNRGFEPVRAFLDAVALEDERVRAGWHHLWHYLRMSRYAESVAALRRTLGPDQVGVWWYDDLVADQEGTTAAVQRFIGVRQLPVAGAGTRVNASGRERSVTVAAALHRASRSSTLRTVVKRTVPFGARERVRNLNLRPAGAPAEVRLALGRRFHDDLDRLEAELGRPVPPGWRS
ncbi:hypothetical protein GCM10023340_04130 [Nocardioides marinquilinus]|uniref:Sulfotransferase n=1 Tax=Nocardioides marinquilinus TaxID=1210400 RepID=A0ABP9PDB4_9ACTN